MQVESTYTLYKLMNKGQYLLCYTGQLAQNQVMSLLALAERKLRNEEIEGQVRKKVFNVMIECLQSFCTNKAETDGNIFILGKGENQYEVLSGFNCDRVFGHRLAAFLDEIEVLDKESLREQHRKMLAQEFSDPSMASFYSLLDIALKSGSPVEYDYETQADQFVFSIKTVIPC